ncbi:MAG: hypothetical protein L0H59_00175 [Tomitella sp.]|nr:hypothetical protein [Tomitella sp.]
MTAIPRTRGTVGYQSVDVGITPALTDELNRINTPHRRPRTDIAAAALLVSTRLPGDAHDDALRAAMDAAPLRRWRGHAALRPFDTKRIILTHVPDALLHMSAAQTAAAFHRCDASSLPPARPTVAYLAIQAGATAFVRDPDLVTQALHILDRAELIPERRTEILTSEPIEIGHPEDAGVRMAV